MPVPDLCEPGGCPDDGKEGTASLTYRRPSAVFAPYSNAEIDAMAGELDPIFAAIVADAATP